MGLFKDIRGISKQAKDLQKASGAKRPSLREGLQQASQAMGDVQASLELQQHLSANGTAVPAVIQAIRPTQQLVNYEPVVEYDLSVKLPDGERPVTVSQATPQVYLAQMTPGAEVQVVIDPTDPDKAMLSWG